MFLWVLRITFADDVFEQIPRKNHQPILSKLNVLINQRLYDSFYLENLLELNVVFLNITIN